MRKLAAFLLLLSGCGVKGNPEPPLEPPVLGQGKAQIKILEAQEQEKKRKRQQKRIETLKDDWDESPDFIEEKK